MPSLSRGEYLHLVEANRGRSRALAVPLSVRLLSDQLTPVLAYRRLVAPDERTAPSFLLESVEGGDRQGRHSILGAHPTIGLVARGTSVTRTERHPDSDTIADVAVTVTFESKNPLLEARALSSALRLVTPHAPGTPGSGLPACFLGGWVGFAGYDTVRYTEGQKLSRPPRDDRNLPDMHFGFYDSVVVFDHADKLVYLVQLIMARDGEDPGVAYDRTLRSLEARATDIQRHSMPLPSGLVGREGAARPLPSNTTPQRHGAMVERAKEYIRSGDIFQVVLGQRFERTSTADPFDVYRALRAVNPSPYMVYLQAEGCILVASSPEILCRVRVGADGRSVVTNRPLAGTRRRGSTAQEDLALEQELLADPKERAEHIMLVDLGRNDVGRVAKPSTIKLDSVMQVERYSHVMHISSTVTGELRDGLDAWDALTAALPVGTISGAPKIRAMQIIDELEPVKRGPYGGGMGYVGLDGNMDIALTLRTFVVPTALYQGGRWTYHIQASGGIVADSQPDAEYQETVNKAAALARAIDVAEQAFGQGAPFSTDRIP